MSFVSVCLYILANYRISLLFVLPLIVLIIAVAMHFLAGRRWGYWLIPAAFTFGAVNVFTGSWVNAAFLHWAGTYGYGVIVGERDAGWLLNEQPVSIYDVLLRTADGKDVVTQFDSMSVSIWPAKNLVLIPPLNEKFVAKYVPGFPRNIAIMSAESAYGKRLAMNQALVPVDRARRLHEASPGNAEFSGAYRKALKAFLVAYRPSLAPDQLASYEKALATLDESLANVACLYESAQQQELIRIDACATLEDGHLILTSAVLADMKFDEGQDELAAVNVQGNWYWVQRDGHARAVFTFDNGADAFSEGLARGPGEHGMVYYDRTLQPVLATAYTWGLPFSGKYALVCRDCVLSEPDSNGHRSMLGATWGIIDREGKEVVPLELTLTEALQQHQSL